MASFDTSDFRKGLKILYSDVPWVITDFQHVKPGKGNAFTRTKLKNLVTGSAQEVTFRSGEKISDPDVEDHTMQFLYEDSGAYHFMNQKTYDQVELTQEAMGDRAKFMLPEMVCDIMFWQGRAISISIPAQVELKITYCEPGARGDTATNVMKPATLETGASIQVPLFINEGDTVKVDTESGSYLERTAIR